MKALHGRVFVRPTGLALPRKTTFQSRGPQRSHERMLRGKVLRGEQGEDQCWEIPGGSNSLHLRLYEHQSKGKCGSFWLWVRLLGLTGFRRSRAPFGSGRRVILPTPTIRGLSIST